jgi:hypothetical protein
MLPFARCYRCALQMRSGAALHFTAIDLTRVADGNELTEIKVTDQRGFPLYVRIADVSAIQAKSGWRYRPLKRWEVAAWIIAAAAVALLIWPR